MSETALTTTDGSTTLLTRGRRAARAAGWGALFLALLVSFTLAKLPDEKIDGYVQGTVADALAVQGIGFAADRGTLSLLFGVKYRFEGVTLTPRPPADPVRLDAIEVSPALLQMLAGRLGGRARITTPGDGQLDLVASLPRDPSSGAIDAGFALEKVDLGKLGLFAMAGGIQGSALAQGSGALEGDPADPKTLRGEIRLDLSRIVIREQTLYGFKIPQLNVSEAKVDLEITDGRARIRSLRLGKEGSTDDLIATVTGDAVIRGSLTHPDLQVKARFRFSDKVKQAFSAIDMLLGAGRQPDGGYAYSLSGPLSMPTVQPGG